MTLMAVCSYCNLNAQIDTLYISTAYTTHVIFSTDLTYADLSNNRIVVARIIDQNKNMLALKARCEFDESTSISALESNGTMHTYIVKYKESPEQLVIDQRADLPVRKTVFPTGEGNVSRSRRSDAPLLSEVVEGKQMLYHLGTRKYGISILCENILSYSDMTYIVLSLKNKSSVSYQISDATFVIESRKKGKRTVAFDKTIFPKNRFGSLSAAGGKTERIAYSFDKMTLSEDQVLKVYFYEDGGQRNLEMTIHAKDINKAGNSFN